MYFDSRPTTVNASITDSLLVSLLLDKRWRYLRFPNRPTPEWNDDIEDFRWRCVVSGIDTDIFDKSLTHIRDAADKSWPFIVRNAREFEFQMCSRLLHLVEQFRLVAKYVVALARQAHAFGPWLKPMHPCWQQSHPALEIPLQSCIHCISVSLSGSKVAIGAGNRVLLLYLNTMLTRQLYLHKCDVTSIAITPDGTRVISGAADGEVRVSDVRTVNVSGDTVFEHYSSVTHISIATSGKFFVTGSADCVCVWNTNAATLADVPLRLRNSSKSSLRGLAISTNGRRVLYATAEMSIPATDMPANSKLNETVRVERKNPIRSDSGESVCSSGEGSAIGSGSSISSVGTDEEVLSRTGLVRPESKYQSSNGIAAIHRSISLSNVNGNPRSSISSHPASEVQRVMIFEVGAGDPPKPVHVNVTERGRGQIPRAFLGCTSDGLAIVRVGIAVVQLIDLETGETIRTIRSVPNWFSCASASSMGATTCNTGVSGSKRQAGEYLFAGWSRSGDDDVAVWRVSKQAGLLSHEGFRLALGRGLNDRDRRRMVNAVAFTTTTDACSQAGGNSGADLHPRILTGATDGMLRIWDAMTSSPARTIAVGNSNGGNALFTWLRICPYGRRIATVARDGQMSIWGFDSGRRLYGDEEGPEDMVTAMAFVADGLRVLLGTNSGNLTLWDPAAEVVYEVTWSQGRYISDIRTHPHDPNVMLVSAEDVVSAWQLQADQLRLLDSWDVLDEGATADDYFNTPTHRYQFDPESPVDPVSDPDPELDHEFNMLSLYENLLDHGRSTLDRKKMSTQQQTLSNLNLRVQGRPRTRSQSHNGRRSVDSAIRYDTVFDSDEGESDALDLGYESRFVNNTHWGMVPHSKLNRADDRNVRNNRRQKRFHPSPDSKDEATMIQVIGRNVMYNTNAPTSNRRQNIMNRNPRMAQPATTQACQHVIATLPAEVNGCNSWNFNEEHGTFAAGLRNGMIVRCVLKT